MWQTADQIGFATTMGEAPVHQRLEIDSDAHGHAEFLARLSCGLARPKLAAFLAAEPAEIMEASADQIRLLFRPSRTAPWRRRVPSFELVLVADEIIGDVRRRSRITASFRPVETVHRRDAELLAPQYQRIFTALREYLMAEDFDRRREPRTMAPFNAVLWAECVKSRQPDFSSPICAEGLNFSNHGLQVRSQRAAAGVRFLVEYEIPRYLSRQRSYAIATSQRPCGQGEIRYHLRFVDDPNEIDPCNSVEN